MRVHAVCCVKLLQSCPTLWDPMDCSSSPGSSVRGILQARTLEWAAVPPLGDLPDPGMRPNCPEVKIVEARWWLCMIHYSIFSTFVYAYNFPNEEPFKSIPKFWIYTKSRVFLQWGCFPIRGPFPFRCVCPDHPESSSFLWGPSPQCGHQNSTSSETAQQFHPPNCLTQRGIES